jgi:hypothetical protein
MHYNILCDASVSPNKEIASGSYMIVTQGQIDDFIQNEKLKTFPDPSDLYVTKQHINSMAIETFTSYLSNFEMKSKSSTTAELELCLNILKIFDQKYDKPKSLKIYTDCSNLFQISKRKIKPTHHNYQLYQDILFFVKKYNIQFVKIKGHKSIDKCVSIYDYLFGIVDKDARQKLRLRVNLIN